MNSKTILHTGLLLTAIGLSNFCLAVDANTKPAINATHTSVTTFRQLDELRTQNAVLAEAVKNAELKNKIENASAVGAGTGAKSGGVPVVIMVTGSDAQLTALIAMPSGNQISAKVGSKIAGVGTVKSISANEVVVANRNKLAALPFAGETGLLIGGGR